MTAVRSLLFLILAAGLGAGLIPLALLPRSPQVETGLFAYLALPLWLLGGGVVGWCFWAFTFRGYGTPAPIDPPARLVTTGLYRIVRNPIYVGVLVILVGHFLWFKALWLLVYAAGAFVVFHLFVVLYEEPTLQARFGAGYDEYRRSVSRWIPKFK